MKAWWYGMAHTKRGHNDVNSGYMCQEVGRVEGSWSHKASSLREWGGFSSSRQKVLGEKEWGKRVTKSTFCRTLESYGHKSMKLVVVPHRDTQEWKTWGSSSTSAERVRLPSMSDLILVEEQGESLASWSWNLVSIQRASAFGALRSPEWKS